MAHFLGCENGRIPGKISQLVYELHAGYKMSKQRNRDKLTGGIYGTTQPPLDGRVQRVVCDQRVP
jgi:hypothetical protein